MTSETPDAEAARLTPSDAGAAERAVERAAGPAAAGTGTGPVAVLAEAFAVAAGSSKVLRRASIYIGLLMLALAGPGVVAGLALLGSAELFEDISTISDEVAGEAGRAAILIALALVGAIVAAVEGTAIGITLLAGHVLDRAISLSAALRRSRKVFWRIIRAGIVVGAIDTGVSHLWGVATGVAQLGDLSAVASEPIPAAIATLPFVYATVAIVLADDGARAALRRSMSIARHNLRLTVALGAFGLVAGVVQTFALGSGLDLILRLTEALHLDFTAGGLSFLLAGALALAVVMAAGSLLFTVTAIVNAPQVVAWNRLGLPLDGLPAVPAPALVEPPLPPSLEPEAVPALDAGAVPRPSFDVEPISAAVVEGQPVSEPVVDAGTVQAPPFEAGPIPAPAPTGWGPPPEPSPSAWAIGAAAERPFHWVTWPMRLTVAGMWLIAIVSLMADRAV